MRQSSVFKKVAFAIIVLYFLLGLIKYKILIIDDGNNFILLTIDIISFSVSLIALWIAFKTDSRNDIRLEIEKICENLTINKYETFLYLYEQLCTKTKYLKILRHKQPYEYLFLIFYKPTIEFFYYDSSNVFYENPELVGKKLKEFIYVLKKVESNIKNENLPGISICELEDRIEIIEKIISISAYYNFYYAINIDTMISELVDIYISRFDLKKTTLSLTCAIVLNNFKFDLNLLKNKNINEENKRELALYFQIHKNANILISIFYQSFILQDNDDIVKICKNIIKLFNDLFCIVGISENNKLLNLICNTELLAIYRLLTSNFSKVTFDNECKILLFSELNIQSTESFLNINNLGDFVLKLINQIFLTDINNYFNQVLSKIINDENACNYYPIFNQYFSSNFNIVTGINWLPNVYLNINSIRKLKPCFLRDIHIFYINVMQTLIRENRFQDAEKIYSDFDYNFICENMTNETSSKFYIQIIRAILINRLEGNYNLSIEFLKSVLECSKFPDINENVRYLIFIFAFERRDKSTCLYVVKKSNRKEKEEYLNIANEIKDTGNIKHLNISKLLYILEPVSYGYIYKDSSTPKIFT